MSNEAARLLWAIKQILEIDHEMLEKRVSDSYRLTALVASLMTLIAGYDFEEQEK